MIPSLYTQTLPSVLDVSLCVCIYVHLSVPVYKFSIDM